MSFYYIQLTDSDNETNTPTGAGWGLANETKRKDGSGDWSNYDPGSGDSAIMFKVTATLK